MRFLMSTLYIAALVACTDGKDGTVEQDECLGSETETDGYQYGCSQALQVPRGSGECLCTNFDIASVPYHERLEYECWLTGFRACDELDCEEACGFDLTGSVTGRYYDKDQRPVDISDSGGDDVPRDLPTGMGVRPSY